MEIVKRGALEALKEVVQGKILLFSQEGIYKLFQERLGLTDPLLYTTITDNPKFEEIAEAQRALQAQTFDVILAFGGGSVIDFAKAFRHYAKLNLPLIAIPTTAGTGSQATQFAVVYVDGKKTSLDAPAILPNVAIVDSQCIEHAPRYLKACCAMDAYCQAIESFWAKKATEESRGYALEAIRLCRDCLVDAVNSAEPGANEKMALAAHLAGKAINISRTTAAHALSYTITSTYGIPHGHAVALTFPKIFCENLGNIQDEATLLAALGIQKRDIQVYFHNLMENIGLEDDWAALGIHEIETIVDSVNLERLENNPKSFTRDELIQTLRHNF